MEKINAFLKKHGIITILIVMLLSFVNQCSIKNSIDRNNKYTKELVKEMKAQDSLINMKMDSTLISNTAVVNTNKQTNNAINSQKQQQVIVKVIPSKSGK